MKWASSPTAYVNVHEKHGGVSNSSPRLWWRCNDVSGKGGDILTMVAFDPMPMPNISRQISSSYHVRTNAEPIDAAMVMILAWISTLRRPWPKFFSLLIGSVKKKPEKAPTRNGAPFISPNIRLFVASGLLAMSEMSKSNAAGQKRFAPFITDWHMPCVMAASQQAMRSSRYADVRQSMRNFVHRPCVSNISIDSTSGPLNSRSSSGKPPGSSLSSWTGCSRLRLSSSWK